MGQKHFQRIYRFGILSLAATLAVGCSSYGGGENSNKRQIIINSTPENASVIANGAEIGSTPLTIIPSDYYHARFTSGGSEGGLVVFRYVGTLTVKKPGCKEYSTQVNDNILSKNIDIQLECDPTYQPVSAEPVAPAPEPVAPEKQPSMTSGNAAERLSRIESLHKKGLLSDEEYQALRKRVLDTL